MQAVRLIRPIEADDGDPHFQQIATSRWALSAEERAIIAAGGEIELTVVGPDQPQLALRAVAAEPMLVVGNDFEPPASR